MQMTLSARGGFKECIVSAFWHLHCGRHFQTLLCLVFVLIENNHNYQPLTFQHDTASLSCCYQTFTSPSAVQCILSEATFSAHLSFTQKLLCFLSVTELAAMLFFL